jgi:hypothetical protein
MKKRRALALLATCVVALAVSIVARIHYLTLRTQSLTERLPTDREPTKEEMQIWQRAIAHHLGAMQQARALSLLVSLGALFASVRFMRRDASGESTGNTA